MSLPRTDPFDYDAVCKLVIVGDSACGKSSLLLRFADDSFDSRHISTIGVDFKIRTIMNKEDNRRLKLQLWDTAGQERFRTITQAYYRGAHGVMVVYDTTRAGSFENVKRWMIDVEQYAPGVPIVLVGNKVDLVEERQVDTEVGKEYASFLGAGFIETSAKTDDNVEECFLEMARRCRQQPRVDPRNHETIKKDTVTLSDSAHVSMLDFVRGLCPMLASGLRR